MTIHVQPVVRPEACPALVLNADYRPLSYYPLSIWGWQDAIKAVFLDRVNIVSEYDRSVRSSVLRDALPCVVSLKTYIKPARHPAFTRFNVFLRDRFICQYCGDTDDLTFDHSCRARKRRPDHAGTMSSPPAHPVTCRRAAAAERGQDVARARSPTGRRCSSSIATAGCSRRTTCTRAGSTISTGIASSSRKAHAAPGRDQRQCREGRRDHHVPSGKRQTEEAPGGLRAADDPDGVELAHQIAHLAGRRAGIAAAIARTQPKSPIRRPHDRRRGPRWRRRPAPAHKARRASIRGRQHAAPRARSGWRDNRDSAAAGTACRADSPTHTRRRGRRRWSPPPLSRWQGPSCWRVRRKRILGLRRYNETQRSRRRSRPKPPRPRR